MVENCGIKLFSTEFMEVFKSYPKNLMVFVCVGYSCLSEPSVLHDTCNSRMFICLHAASVHATQLHRLCIRASHGQRHGKILASALDSKTQCYLSSPILMFLCPCFLRWKPASSWTSWVSSRSLWPWTRGALPCSTWTRIQNGLSPSTSLLLWLMCTSHLSRHSMLRSDRSPNLGMSVDEGSEDCIKI